MNVWWSWRTSWPAASTSARGAITVTGLHKSYDDFEAAASTSLGEWSGVCIPRTQWAGKTTTVEILEGYRARSGGDVRVLEYDPATGGAPMRRRIGVVLQQCGFPRCATVHELVTLNARFYPTPRPVDEAIELTELTANRTKSSVHCVDHLFDSR